MRERKESRKVFFFEKKKQKTFVRCRGLVTGVRKKAKVFWFFFSKKNALLSAHDTGAGAL